MTLHVGFTGSRTGMTDVQRDVLDGKLGDLMEHTTERPVLHTGSCVGADSVAHVLAWARGYKMVLHPPADPKLRSWIERRQFWDDHVDVVLPEEEYLARDRAIVNCSSILLATPDGEPRTQSGTWYTVRFAQRSGVETMIIMPDGTIR